MNKIPCTSQNMEAETLPADVCIFGRLSPAAVHTADCWFNSGVKWWIMFHPLSHIYAKIPFCCVETVANNAQNYKRVIVFDQLWVNTAPTFNTTFSLTNVYIKWWIHSLPSCCGLPIRPVEEQLKQWAIGKCYCISRKRKSYKGSTSCARLAVHLSNVS